jgi:hypothetical protein
LLGERKYSLDLIRETVLESDWRDQELRMLSGDERSYYEAFMGLLAHQRGI